MTIPREYRQQIVTQRQGVEDIKQTLLSLIKANEEEEDKASEGDVDTRLLSSSVISKKFMVRVFVNYINMCNLYHSLYF
ncbi:hypothetical protein EON65_50535 [archaeon]|nr:MAG: hypothetical protein EON65_50535 [archaeon]